MKIFINAYMLINHISMKLLYMTLLLKVVSKYTQNFNRKTYRKHNTWDTEERMWKYYRDITQNKCEV